MEKAYQIRYLTTGIQTSFVLHLIRSPGQLFVVAAAAKFAYIQKNCNSYRMIVKNIFIL